MIVTLAWTFVIAIGLAFCFLVASAFVAMTPRGKMELLFAVIIAGLFTLALSIIARKI